ncbi:hypothetical protein [Euzebya rosea]|uniref:hypothetical protein n=1 Tax=Euzebya rosea TaxID=2052804 RepID=UPI000D3E3C27|nr:hypothetical protein [Euzebya rosea]
MRLLVLLLASALAVVQGVGVLGRHDHSPWVGDGGAHAHAFVADGHDHMGHADDAQASETTHPSAEDGTTAARAVGAGVLLAASMALLGAVGLRPELDDRLQGRRRPRHRVPRQRLAVLSILRV